MEKAIVNGIDLGSIKPPKGTCKKDVNTVHNTAILVFPPR